MNKFLLIILSSFLAVSGFTQSNLIVFAENGEAFTMTVDGAEAENVSDSRVKFEGIKGDFVQVRITFNDQFPDPIKKRFMIEADSEITIIMKQNRKGAYVLRPMSTVPITSVVKAELPPPPPHPDVMVEEVDVIKDITTASEDEVVTTTTTSTTEAAPTSINMGIGGSKGGIKMDVNININDAETIQDGIGVSSTSSTTTTTTTTTTTSSSSQNYADEIIEVETIPEDVIIEETIKEVEIACSTMLDSDYNSAKNSISKKSFADDKMTVAKQIIRANCVSTSQIVGIMRLFNFEDDKLEFAKVAYKKATDPQNYHKVNDAFTFSSSTDELNEFLEDR